jgi:predicted transcriptional regulator
MNYQLINFNIPIKLKDQLDLIAKHKHVSRTAIINIQLEQYCRKELPMIITNHECLEALDAR